MKLTGVVVTAVVAALLVAGCSGISERRKIDYKSAKRLPPLDIPPDLTIPETSERYAILDEGGATYSNYTRERAAARGAAEEKILPAHKGMRIEAAGDFRWLVVDITPNAAWQPVREFWQENGFLIARENPEAGIMETDWAENRAKIPDSLINKGLSMIGLNRLYSYPERDKFRTRLEYGAEPGTSEIFISHRGIYETVVNLGSGDRKSTVWEVRPRDPGLEAEMLYLLMARLGGTKEQIEKARTTPDPPPRAVLASDVDNLEYLELKDPFDRAWRRVGLALDYIGFTVEDRDRSKGVYFVRYNDPDKDVKATGLAKLAFWRDEKPVAENYQIQVKGSDDSDSQVYVLDQAGIVISTPTSKRILSLLRQELK